jgi:hypothetical protein
VLDSEVTFILSQTNRVQVLDERALAERVRRQPGWLQHTIKITSQTLGRTIRDGSSEGHRR